MLKKVFAFVVAVFAALALSSLGSPAHAEDVYKCEDFEYQEDAQAEYRATPGDPHGLDGRPGPQDDDGEACENRPHRPVSDTEDDAAAGTEDDTLPVTGLDTSTWVLLIGSVTLLLSGGLFFAAGRIGRRKTG